MLQKNILFTALKILRNITLIFTNSDSSTASLTKLKPIILEGELIDQEGNYFLIRNYILKALPTPNIHLHCNNEHEIVVQSKNKNLKLGDKVRVIGFIRENLISFSIENATIERIDNF